MDRAEGRGSACAEKARESAAGVRYSICSVVGSVSPQNISRSRRPIFLDIETKPKTEKTDSSVRFILVRFFRYGLKVPSLTIEFPFFSLPFPSLSSSL